MSISGLQSLGKITKARGRGFDWEREGRGGRGKTLEETSRKEGRFGRP